MKYGVVILLVVGITHWGYDFIARTPEQARWLFYILRGVEGSVAFFLLSTLLDEPLAIVACWLGIWEESQTAVCGMASMSENLYVPQWSGLCVERFGFVPYLLASAFFGFITWKRTNDRKS